MMDDAEREAAALASGRPLFTDDLPEPPDMLHAALALAPVAHAALLGLDLAAARTAPGVHVVLAGGAAGVAGPDGPLLAEAEVVWDGQPVAAVAAETRQQARRAARLVEGYYDARPAVLNLADAVADERLTGPQQAVERGDAAAALAGAPRRLRGRLEIGGQPFLTLEGPVVSVIPRVDGGWLIQCVTDDPAMVQAAAAAALGAPMHGVAVECRRIGGGAFGGQGGRSAAVYVCLTAALARACRRPVKLRPDRETAARLSGRRHGFTAEFDVGYDDDGRVLGLEVFLAADVGAMAPADPAAAALLARAMGQIAGACAAPDLSVFGRACRTHAAANFDMSCSGIPQGAAVMQQILAQVAAAVGRDPLEVGLLNVPPGDIAVALRRAADCADYARRRGEIAAFNRVSGGARRGLSVVALTTAGPASATTAQVLVRILADGSVLLAHGGVATGQGVNAKAAQAVAAALDIDRTQVRAQGGATEQAPDMSGVASAEDWADAAGDAARILAARLAPFRVATADFAAAVAAAQRAGVSLSAVGGRLSADGGGPAPIPAAAMTATAAAVVESEIDPLTGVCRVRRADLLYDAAGALAPEMDQAVVEGAFGAGLAWAMNDGPARADDGRLLVSDFAPLASAAALPDLRLWPSSATASPTVSPPRYHSQAINEAALALGLSGWLAAQDAVCAAVGAGVALNIPVTPEPALAAISQGAARL